MALSKEVIEAVKKHADIVNIISSYLPVEKKGKDYKAVCPFHDDTNPSLSISPEKQIFRCFVCGTSGNAITFVQKYTHVSFIEAVKKVAELSGFHSPELEKEVFVKPVDAKREPLIKCLKDLTTYYQYALNLDESKEGLDYFESRHLDSELRSRYKLGYALKDGRKTIAFLQQKGHSLKTIEDVGVSSSAGNPHDLNQGRVVFPICDADGDVVGFSARRLGDGDDPKYVNTKDTYLFKKNGILYNYHIAKEDARLKNYVYICEGFMDVFALAKIGINACVATMGTALTNEHVELLRRLNVEIRVCLDGDLPGQTAALKASGLLEKAGLNVTIVNTKGNLKDPDEILNEDGPDALKVYLNNLYSRSEFALDYYLRSNPLKDNESKRKLVASFVPVLLKIKNVLEFDTYVRKLASITGYDTESIKSFVNKSRQADSDNVIRNAMKEFHPERKALKKLELAEREFLYQMLGNKSAVAFYEQKIGGFYDEVYRAIANFLADYATNHEFFDVSDMISSLETSELENKEELINELSNLAFERNHPNKCSDDLLNNLLQTINSEKERIFEEDTLRQSLEGKDPLEQARILNEHNRRKLKKLK